MSKEKILETINIFALEIISNYRRTGSVCENDTFNSKFEPGEMIFDCFGFSFLISASTFFNVKKKNQLEDSEVTSDCVSHDATASGDQVGFNGQLFGKSV